MFFGVNSDEIKVTLDATTYSAGDTIRGNLRLKLKNPVEARGLRLVFSMIIGSGKHRRETVFEKLNIDGSRTYRDGEEFPFKFIVPQSAAVPIYQFGGITGVLSKIMNLGERSIGWYIEATLDLPMKLDIDGCEEITINRPIVQK